jgi:hypothetical protein
MSSVREWFATGCSNLAAGGGQARAGRNHNRNCGCCCRCGGLRTSVRRSHYVRYATERPAGSVAISANAGRRGRVEASALLLGLTLTQRQPCMLTPCPEIFRWQPGMPASL